MARWTTLLVGVLAAEGVAFACSCRPVTAEGAVRSGDPIVLATIGSVRRSGAGGGRERKVATVDVTEVIAGPGTLGERRVWTSLSEAACGLDLEAGDLWVLQISGVRSVSLCSASRRIEGPDDPWVEELRETAAGG